MNVPAATIVVGTGIRSILEGLFTVLADRIETLWLPEDVYPIYWQLSARLRRRGFATLPDVDWSVLDASGPRDAVLLPCPLSPIGRSFSEQEHLRLVEWLRAHSERRLILDRAYSFTSPPDRERDVRLRGSQTISIWSLSKPWLSRGLLGIASVPAAMRDQLQSQLTSPEPSQIARASAMIDLAPTLPALLTERFASAWARLMPAILSACPSWRPPESGYFSILPAVFDKLLAEHDLLAIPATVFGSKRTDLSVASCLYDIEILDGIRRHDGSRCPDAALSPCTRMRT
ncbi:MAG: aminotransferase class I/II-fold pyridoxal phosphate-dependent enzyme [Thermoanaerobaculia bacterium]